MHTSTEDISFIRDRFINLLTREIETELPTAGIMTCFQRLNYATHKDEAFRSRSIKLSFRLDNAVAYEEVKIPENILYKSDAEYYKYLDEFIKSESQRIAAWVVLLHSCIGNDSEEVPEFVEVQHGYNTRKQG